MRIKKFTMVLFGLLFLWTAASARTFYVKQGASSLSTGTSWSTANGDLQAMIDAAYNYKLANPGERVHVWVAEGIYKPLRVQNNDGSNASIIARDYAFVLRPNVEVYGGFPANSSGSDGMERRNWNTNVTTLSGDIDNDGIFNNGNAHHVVIASDAGNNTSTFGYACLDGFTVTGANSNTNSSLKLNNRDIARNYGGAIYINYYVSLRLSNLIITGSSASVTGGGLHIEDYSESVVTNVLICGNAAGSGGGVFLGTGSKPVFVNVTIAGNANGAVFNENNASPRFYNSIIWGNTSSGVSGGSSSYYNSLVQGRNDVTNNCINASLVAESSVFQQLVKATNTTTPTVNGSYRLRKASAAINAGSVAHWTTTTAINGSTVINYLGLSSINDVKDLDNDPRLIGDQIDMGAYEFTPLPDTRFYVKATGSGDGTSWNNASSDLQAMIDKAYYYQGNAEVWVAAGTYVPKEIRNNDGTVPSTDRRDNAFVLRPYVKVYGGFPAGATNANNDNFGIRNWTVNKTTLSGDINGDDDGTSGKYADNCYHIVIAADATDGATLDGFVISGANGNANSNLTINTKTIHRRNGGGIHIHAASPVLTNLIIQGNKADNVGGGIYAEASGTNFVLTNVLIHGNTSGNGGGMYNNSNTAATLTNVTVAGNFASTNNTGGISNNGNSANLKLRNTLVWNNNSNNGVSGMNSGNVTYTNSLVQGVNNTTNGNISANTITNLNSVFRKTSLPTAVATPVTSGDYRLRIASPAIDAGDNAHWTTALTELSGKSIVDYLGLANLGNAKDLDNGVRVKNAKIDMGVYEYEPYTVSRYYVKANGTGNGSSWSTASSNLQAMIDKAYSDGVDSEVWVAAGTYVPRELKNNDGTTPASITARDYAFVMRPDVKIYGGFSADAQDGDGMDLRSWRTNVTTLSGDVDNDKVFNNGNAHHVVVASGNGNNSVGSACLDGFTITGGNAANGNGANVTINSIAMNRAFGGGIYVNTSTSPRLNNLIVTGNHAGQEGGGIHFEDHSASVVSNTLISGNTAGTRGGGVTNGASAVPTFINVTIAGNYAQTNGGAIANENGNTAPRFYNSIIFGNNSGVNGGNQNNFFNSLIQGRNVTTNGCFSAELIASANLVFVNPVMATAGTPTTAGDYRLSPISPAINNGDNAHWTTTQIGGRTLLQLLGLLNSEIAGVKDLNGISRIYSDSNIDMGAYEYQGYSRQTRFYVKQNGTGNGTSWSSASNDLQLMIDAAQINGDTVFVAAGTYRPSRIQHNNGSNMTTAGVAGLSAITSRDYAFVMRPNVKIFGGFSADAQDGDGMKRRDWAANATILSGDLNGNDDGTATSRSENTYHVVVASNSGKGVMGDACLDGFTVTGGNANGNGAPFLNGGTINRRFGGGVTSNWETTVTYRNLIIRGNNAEDRGGGVHIEDNSETVLINVLICGNTAGDIGGGITNGIASKATYINVTIAGNYARNGGGALNNQMGSTTPTFYNCVIWGNSSGPTGGSPRYYNSLVQGRNEVTNNCIASHSIADQNSIFMNTVVATAAGITNLGDYRLKEGSIVIDKGNNSYLMDAFGFSSVTELLETADLGGHIRLGGTAVDMGAYEFGTPYYVVEEEEVDVTLDLTVFLLGPTQSNGTMTNYIQTADPNYSYFDTPQLPTTDPYGLSVTYADINNVMEAGPVVDWIRVEIWDAEFPAGALESQALLLRPDGTVVGIDGNAPKFDLQPNPVRIVVKHRNHLAVMSNEVSSFKGQVEYDFSTSIDKAYKLATDTDQLELKGNRYCLISGDVQNDGYVDGSDFIRFRADFNNATSAGKYLNSDLDMDGYIDSRDNSAFLSRYTEPHGSTLYNFE